MSEPERPAPPSGLSHDGDLAPRRPFTWLRESAPGGFTADGWQLLAAWTTFTAATSAAWATHLKDLAGSSALPSHWGEHLSARQVWELWENGGLREDPIGPLAPIVAVLALVWALWAGWRMQARTVGLAPRFRPWALGFLDALLLGALPLLSMAWMATGLLGWLADSGLQGLGWMDLVLGNVLKLAAVSAWMLQWWFCRLGRAHGVWQGLDGYLQHLQDSFLRLWIHPVQWTLLLVGGAALRTGMGVGVLLLGWRWGGGATFRVWGFLLLQVGATLASAWLIGWLLRLSALFWRQDCRVRQAVADLKRGLAEPFTTPEASHEA